MVVKCAPQLEWPAESNVETHWSWDLRSETLERTFEACCLSGRALHICHRLAGNLSGNPVVHDLGAWREHA
jgi:hypothetical protein